VSAFVFSDNFRAPERPGPFGCPRQRPEAIFATARSDARPLEKGPPSMVVAFPHRGAEMLLDSFAAVPLRRRRAGPPRCLSWAQAAAQRHAPRRHVCLEAIVNVARSLRKRHGPKQGASCWPKNGATNCQARLTALTASRPLLAPRCAGRARVRICAHACIRAQ